MIRVRLFETFEKKVMMIIIQMSSQNFIFPPVIHVAKNSTRTVTWLSWDDDCQNSENN